MKTRVKHQIDLAADFAGVRTPRFAMRRLKAGYAFYSPFLHRITLDHRLCAELDAAHLQTLIAHEVGHARQRRQMITEGLHLLCPGIAFMVTCSIVGLWLAHSKGWHPALSLIGFAFGLAGSTLWDRWAMPRWQRLVALREAEADTFANEFLQNDNAIAAAMAACKRLHV